jgi:PAS domain-containing protein
MESKLSLRNSQTLNSDYFYRKVFQASSAGQAIIDQNLNIISVNNKMFDFFEIKPSDVLGLPFGKVFNCLYFMHNSKKCGKRKDCKYCGLLMAVRNILLMDTNMTNDIISYSYRIGKRRTMEMFYLVSSKIMTASNENYASLIFLDITELKRQEKRMRDQLIIDLSTGA